MSDTSKPFINPRSTELEHLWRGLRSVPNVSLPSLEREVKRGPGRRGGFWAAVLVAKMWGFPKSWRYPQMDGFC